VVLSRRWLLILLSRLATITRRVLLPGVVILLRRGLHRRRTVISRLVITGLVITLWGHRCLLNRGVRLPNAAADQHDSQYAEIDDEQRRDRDDPPRPLGIAPDHAHVGQRRADLALTLVLRFLQRVEDETHQIVPRVCATS